MPSTTWVAIAIACTLSGCRPSKPMVLCKKAEAAGLLEDCWEFEGGRGRATDVVIANGAQGGRVYIGAYGSQQTYEADLRDKEIARARCLYGAEQNRMIVHADGETSEQICRAVYDIVAADR
jgi:hypothetical protein